MRRQERAVMEQDKILEILEKCEVARIGFCADGRAYIVPMNFAFAVEDGGVALYFHSAVEGRKIAMLKQNPQVCFEADCSYQLIKCETACRWTAHFESVMGEGEITMLTNAAQKARALDLIMRRHGFEGAPAYTEEALRCVCVLRLAVTHMCGKQNLPG